MDEISALTPDLGGVSHERLATQGLQWPAPTKEHPGSPILYEKSFKTASGRAALFCVDWLPPGEAASESLPFVLITGRQLAHYNSGTQTRRTGNVVLQPEDQVEVHPTDAARLGIGMGDQVEVRNTRGAVRAFACVTTRVAPGNVFLAFHFPDVKTNLLTSSNADPFVSCPEYKVTAVDVTRVGGPDPSRPTIARGFRPDAFDG